MKLEMELSKEFNEAISKNIVERIFKGIENIIYYEDLGVKLSDMYDIEPDYRYLYIEKNYIFYRYEEDTIKIVMISNEKQDFIQSLLLNN